MADLEILQHPLSKWGHNKTHKSALDVTITPWNVPDFALHLPKALFNGKYLAVQGNGSQQQVSHFGPSDICDVTGPSRHYVLVETPYHLDCRTYLSNLGRVP
jgi:5-methylthioribose kinase